MKLRRIKLATKRIAALAIATAALLITGLTLLPAENATAASASPGDFVSRINSLRASHGLPALTIDGRLSSEAQGWSSHMASAGSISHNPALGSTPGSWTSVGENVGQGSTIDAIFNALVASPGHYANMVNSSFNSVGVGISVGSNGQIFTVHDFANYPGAGSGSKPAQPTPAKTPALAPSPASAPKVAASTPSTKPAAQTAPNNVAPTAPVVQAAPPATPAPDPAAQVALASVASPGEPSLQIVSSLNDVGTIQTQG